MLTLLSIEDDLPTGWYPYYNSLNLKIKTKTVDLHSSLHRYTLYEKIGTDIITNLLEITHIVVNQTIDIYVHCFQTYNCCRNDICHRTFP